MSNYAICTVAAAPVRKEDAHRSEMTSQLLFGETVEVLEEKGDWLRIRGIYDGYEGWITYHLIEPVAESIATGSLQYVTTGLVNQMNRAGEVLNLPMGCSLTGYDQNTKALWDPAYTYQGSLREIKTPFDTSLLRQTAMAWLNAPYLWGGKTFLGVDCSGFVQTVFKIMGLPLLRDAYQQAEQGSAVEALQDVKLGDLAFFHNEKGKITHVGMLLSNEQIIHSSGRVRVDQIDKEGITNTSNGKRTHQLHSVRRVF